MWAPLWWANSPSLNQQCDYIAGGIPLVAIVAAYFELNYLNGMKRHVEIQSWHTNTSRGIPQCLLPYEIFN